MSRYRKLLAVAVSAVAVLSVTTAASASRSIESSQRTTSALWEALTITSPELEVPVVCRVGINLSLANTRYAKVVGSQVGLANGVVIERERCSGGTMLLLEDGRQTWPLIYQGFNGTLPAITGIRFNIQRVALLIVGGGGLARCLYEGTVSVIMNVGSRGEVTSITANESTRIRLRTTLPGSLFCPANVTLRGTGGIVLSSTTLRLL